MVLGRERETVGSEREQENVTRECKGIFLAIPELWWQGQAFWHGNGLRDTKFHFIYRILKNCSIM